jgi:hypothetical protein
VAITRQVTTEGYCTNHLPFRCDSFPISTALVNNGAGSASIALTETTRTTYSQRPPKPNSARTFVQGIEGVHLRVFIEVSTPVFNLKSGSEKTKFGGTEADFHIALYDKNGAVVNKCSTFHQASNFDLFSTCGGDPFVEPCVFDGRSGEHLRRYPPQETLNREMALRAW